MSTGCAIAARKPHTSCPYAHAWGLVAHGLGATRTSHLSNPHTPISTAKYLVPGLRTSDLEGLAVDREVPDVLRRFAWTALQRRLLYRARRLLR